MYVLDANIPNSKKTVLGLYVTAKEAYDKWKSNPEKIKIIDVRTQEEFLFVGFAPMAWKIPVAEQSFVWDDEKKQYPLLPKIDFVNRVKEIAREDDMLMVMCRSGGRSAIAVNMLAEAGFKNVYQIVDGMEGDIVTDEESVFKGQRMMNGWKNAGCPWTNELSPWRLIPPKSSNEK